MVFQERIIARSCVKVNRNRDALTDQKPLKRTRLSVASLERFVSRPRDGDDLKIGIRKNGGVDGFIFDVGDSFPRGYGRFRAAIRPIDA